MRTRSLAAGFAAGVLLAVGLIVPATQAHADPSWVEKQILAPLAPSAVASDHGGHMFAGTQDGVVELNATTGAVIAGFSTMNDGLGMPTRLAYGDGRVFFQDQTHNLVALDATTGALIPGFTPPTTRPYDFAADASGHLYATNGSVTELDASTGTVLTQFSPPKLAGSADGVAVDGAGNVYVGEDSGAVVELNGSDGSQIVAFSAQLSGTGVGNPGFLNLLALDDAGHLFVSLKALSVDELDASTGSVIRHFVYDPSPASSGTALAADGSEQIYVLVGLVLTKFDVGTGAQATAFVPPTNSYGYPSLLTSGPNSVLHAAYAPMGPAKNTDGVVRFDGAAGTLDAGFNYPSSTVSQALSLYDDGLGHLYIAVSPSQVIEVDAATGSRITSFNTTADGLASPSGVTGDGNGHLWVADGSKVVEIDASSGALIQPFSTASDNLNQPGIVATDGHGHLYVAEVGTTAHTTQIVELDAATGAVLPAFAPSINNSTMSGLAVDSLDHVFVHVPSGIDEFNGTTGALMPGIDAISGVSPGPGGMSVDSAGDVYLGDEKHGIVEFVAPAPSVPGAPTGVQTTGADGALQVSWSAPASDGGSAITGYTATAVPGNASCTTAGATVCTISGLANGQQYAVTVTATNANGVGPASTSGTGTPLTVPDPPSNVDAIAGPHQVTVSWDAPAFDGGSPIVEYDVKAVAFNYACSSTSATSCVVVGLNSPGTYEFTVTARNAAGVGPASLPSNLVSPVTAPSAPQSVVTRSASGQVTVSWSPPDSDGGSSITEYDVTADPGGADCSTDTLSCTVTGLTNGAQYSFAVVAVNAYGTSSPAGSGYATPIATPAAPTGVAATVGNGSSVVSWTASTNDGGSPIVGYTVTAVPGGSSCSTTGATTCTLTGLDNGQTYSITVAATNGAGTGPASNVIAVTPASVPEAPRNATASPGNGQISVAWDAPTSDGGASITDYIATASPGGSMCTTTLTSCTISGLTNGTNYSVTVVAVNANGMGAPSATATATPLPPLPARLAGPTLVGTSRVGGRLTCSASFSNATHLAYQWTRNGSWIGAAQLSSYLVTSADFNTRVGCRVIASNIAGSAPVVAVSGPLVGAGSPLHLVVASTLSGTGKGGSRLYVHVGRWSPSATSYVYTWLVNGVAVSGQRGSSFVVPAGDKGKSIGVRVYAVRRGYEDGVSTPRAVRAS